MNQQEALAVANAMISEWIQNPPTNDRGYPRGDFKMPTIEERAASVQRLAEFLWNPTPVTRHVVDPTLMTVYGWPIDGRAGKPSKAQYDVAKAVIQSAATNRRLMTTDEAGALQLLIEAYEAPDAAGARTT